MIAPIDSVEEFNEKIFVVTHTVFVCDFPRKKEIIPQRANVDWFCVKVGINYAYSQESTENLLQPKLEKH